MATDDPRPWMWAEAAELLERAERLQRQFFQLRRSPARRPTWEPPVDIYETDETLWIVVALVGVAPEQVEVVIDNGLLTVAGERRLPVGPREAHIHRLEIPHGRFERQIQLPAGRYELGRRDLHHGLLVLSLSKLG